MEHIRVLYVNGENAWVGESTTHFALPFLRSMCEDIIKIRIEPRDALMVMTIMPGFYGNNEFFKYWKTYPG
jgi:hypothetical protein